MGSETLVDITIRCNCRIFCFRFLSSSIDIDSLIAFPLSLSLLTALTPPPQELVALLEDVVDETKWRLHGTRFGVTCQMERPDAGGGGSKLLRFRIEAVLESDLFSCMAAMNEVADFKLWLPGVDQSSVLHEVSLFRRVLRCSGAKPWPIPRDEILTAAYGDTCDARDFLGAGGAAAGGLGSGVALYMRPAGPEWPRTPGCTAVDLTGGYWFEAVGPNKTRVLQVGPPVKHAKPRTH